VVLIFSADAHHAAFGSITFRRVGAWFPGIQAGPAWCERCMVSPIQAETVVSWRGKPLDRSSLYSHAFDTGGPIDIPVPHKGLPSDENIYRATSMSRQSAVFRSATVFLNTSLRYGATGVAEQLKASSSMPYMMQAACTSLP